MIEGLSSRSEALARMQSESFDVLVIGGGITGAGVALDAATRGYSVALIEKSDYASGTSGKSSKLIHGGLRYLETADFRLMYESAAERDLLRRRARGIVRPLGFFWPEWSGGRRKAGVGLTLYDFLAAYRNERRHKKVDAAKAAEIMPGTKRSGGGYLFYDSVTDDVRLTMAVLKSAVRYGTVACNYVSAEELLTASGRVTGVAASASGQELSIRATHVVNATGVWADELGLEGRRLRPSKGVHLVFRRSAIPVQAACLLKGAGRRALVFVIPWRSSVIVGTTDDEYNGPTDAPTVEPADAEYLLSTLERAFRDPPGADDVTGAYAGLRPLLADTKKDSTRDLSRRHAVIEGSDGLITVTGGKLTTFRRMAKDVVDLIASRSESDRKCVTARVGLASGAQRRTEELDDAVWDSLEFSYGTEAPDVARFCAQNSETTRLDASLPYLEGELRWAVRNEQAVSIGDLFTRRTRMSLEDPRAGLGCAEMAERVISEELGLDRTELAMQREGYVQSVARERGAVSGGLSSSGETQLSQSQK